MRISDITNKLKLNNLLFTRTCAVTIFIFDLRNKGCRCLVGNTKKCFRLERSFFFASILQMFFQGISWLMIRKWHTRMQNSRTCFFWGGGVPMSHHAYWTLMHFDKGLMWHLNVSSYLLSIRERMYHALVKGNSNLQS